jgi:hypothetical protein
VAFVTVFDQTRPNPLLEEFNAMVAGQTDLR